MPIKKKFLDTNIKNKSKTIHEKIQLVHHDGKQLPLPTEIEISESGVCNRKCSFCPRSDPGFEDINEFISEELVLKISKEPVSLEKPVGDEEDSSLGDFIEDTKALAPLEQAIKSNLGEATTKILSTLTPREERVLRMRFGVGMNTDHTLEEVGLQFSVTRERIRQIEAKALRKLKHPSRSKQLKSFLES